MPARTDLWLVRHAGSEHHGTGRLPWPEVALSTEGERQAQRLADRLAGLAEVAALYSSPQRRAWDTAVPIAAALGLTASAHPGLREADFGLAGGLTIAECQHRWPELMAQWADRADQSFRWPEGESRAESRERAVKTMQALVQAHLGQRIVVVAHTGVLCSYLAHILLGDGSRWREVLLRPASVTQVEVDGRAARFLLRDDIAHLEEGSSG